MPRTGDVDHVQIERFDDPVEMDVDEVEPGCCAPVSKQAWLDVGLRQRPAQERIVE